MKTLTNLKPLTSTRTTTYSAYFLFVENNGKARA